MTRHLVVCTDGTWNQPDQRDRDRIVPSNVVKMARAIAGKTTDNIPQLVYYDTGVGTGVGGIGLKAAPLASAFWTTSSRPTQLSNKSSGQRTSSSCSASHEGPTPHAAWPA